MGIFQKLADMIKGFKTPGWLKVILQEIQSILVVIALQVGKDYLTNLQNKIISVSQLDVSNTEKFRQVFNYGKQLLPTIKDSYLNLLIELLVSRLKVNKVV